MHLDDARLIDLIRGAGDSGDAAHLDRCEACRGRQAWWRGRLDDLRLLSEQTVGESELHRLKVMFRQRAPQPSGLRRWLAELVPATLEPAGAVRGPVAGGVVEYRGGPVRVLLQLSGGADAALHGQLLDEDGMPVADGGHVVVRGDGEVAYTAVIDDLGEFHVTGLRPGRYSVSWWVGDARIDLDTLTVEDHVGE